MLTLANGLSNMMFYLSLCITFSVADQYGSDEIIYIYFRFPTFIGLGAQQYSILNPHFICGESQRCVNMVS